MNLYELTDFIFLAAIEAILGVDNIILISVAVSGLKSASERALARIIGLGFAFFLRLVALYYLKIISHTKESWFEIFGIDFSYHDVLACIGGLFLIYKGIKELVEEGKKHKKSFEDHKFDKFGWVAFQVIFIDLIFSLDSIFTAVAMSENLIIIGSAFFVAMVFMLIISEKFSALIDRFIEIKIIALAFITLVGVFLVAEGLGFKFNKNYLYFAAFFSSLVSGINIWYKKNGSLNVE